MCSRSASRFYLGLDHRPKGRGLGAGERDDGPELPLRLFLLGTSGWMMTKSTIWAQAIFGIYLNDKDLGCIFSLFCVSYILSGGCWTKHIMQNRKSVKLNSAICCFLWVCVLTQTRVPVGKKRRWYKRALSEDTISGSINIKPTRPSNVFGNIFQCAVAVVEDCMLPAGCHTVSCFKTSQAKT